MDTKVLRHCLTAWVICLFTPPAISQESRVNPFAPLLEHSGGGNATDAYLGKQDQGTHPLKQHPVKNYTLMGVIDSPDFAVAMIRSLSGEEFFVHEGDQLGNNEGVITAIYGTGIEVEEKEEVILLNVRNRSVTIEKEDS